MKAFTRRALTAAALGSTLLATALSGTASAGGHGLECGDSVTRSVRLTADLVNCPGTALTIAADGITVDLAGHAIDGTGADVGIYNGAGHDAVTIRGGTIRDFAQGIDLLEDRGTRVRDMVLEQNLIGLTSGRSQSTTVTDVTARDNEFAGIDIFQTEGFTLRRSRVIGHDHAGVIDRATYDSRYTDNVFTDNVFYGLLLDNADHAVATRNVAADNEFAGISLGFRTRTALLERNTVTGNGEHGISIDEPGNVLRRNTAVGNGGYGIAAVYGTYDGGGNRATDNALGGCLFIRCR